MHENIQIVLETEESSPATRVVLDGLDEFNRAAAGDDGYQPLNLDCAR